MEQRILEDVFAPHAPVNTAEVYGKAVAAAHNEFVAELTTALADARGQVAVLSALNDHAAKENERLAAKIEKLEAELETHKSKGEAKKSDRGPTDSK